MTVVWYYTVGAERKGPVSWNDIRDAVARSVITAESYVWTAAFGTQWRKASTLTGLFPSAADSAEAESPRDTSSNTAANAAPQDPVVILKSAEQTQSQAQSAKDVNCIAALGTAWFATKALLFNTAPFMRWFTLSLCVILTLFSPFLPMNMTSQDKNRATRTMSPTIQKLKLEEVLTTGIYAAEIDFLSAEFFDKFFKNPKIFNAPLRQTAIAINTWLHVPQNKLPRAATAVLILAILAICIWFQSRGTMLFIGRIFTADHPFHITWFATAKASAGLFRGMFVLKAVFYTAVLQLATHDISLIAKTPVGTPISPEIIGRIILHMLLIPTVDIWLSSFVSDFVAPRMALSNKTFGAAFSESIRSVNLWYFTYLMMLGAAWSLLFLIMMFVSAIVGQNAIALLSFFLLSPPSNVIFTLPIRVCRRIWTLEIVFRTNPALRPK